MDWSPGISQFLHLPVAYEEAGTLVSFQPCGGGLCALTNCSRPCPPAHCEHPSLPLFLQAGLHAHSAFGGCKDPFISSASRYPKQQLCFMPLARSFLDCCGLAQKVLGAEGKCQPLVTGATSARYANTRCIPAVLLQARTRSKCSWLEVMRRGTAA